MKKRGFTMVELMVSISIIAVVMVFLVRLLVDVKYDSTNELFDTANQINRAEIIKTIQEDWKDKSLKGITDNNSDKSIALSSDAGNAKISFSKDDKYEYIHYEATNGKVYKWKLEKNNSETYIQKTNIPFKIINSPTYGDGHNDYVILIDIPIIIDKSDIRKNDSKMDNISLTFYSYGNNSIVNRDYLNAE